MNTVDRMRGRWKEILPRFGVDTSYLRNRHGPCPLCGGKDRFRFDDKAGSGSYFCSQCGASTGEGAGIRLLMKFRDWDFRTAAMEIDRIVGDCRPLRLVHSRPERPTPKSRTSEAQRAAAIERLIAEATNPNVVDRYLARRGVHVRPQALLGHPSCPYWNEEGELLGRFPAVVVPIVNRDGELESVQRIYEADVEPRKKNSPADPLHQRRSGSPIPGW